MNEEKFLKMSFDPQTIEHLGVKMYSQIPNAIAELIANSYDADATEVNIYLFDNSAGKEIQVVDDGIGMDFDEINDHFLRIGRNRRKSGAETSLSGKREVTGRKGLGKLALFGIGDVIEVVTTKKGSGNRVKFVMDWQKLIGTEQGDYKPDYEIEECDLDRQGTTISLRNLRRKSGFDKHQLAISLSRLFNLFDADFRCYLTHNSDEAIEVDNQLKYQSIASEFKWKFPDLSNLLGGEYSLKDKISGSIISTGKPLKPGLRGVILFAKGRLANQAEFYGISESSHGFSYITGWLDVDFIDDMEEDVISTNRQSLNWELPGIIELKKYLASTLRSIEIDWRKKRKEKRQKSIRKKTNIDTLNWYGALPPDIRPKIEFVVNAVFDRAELTNEESEKIISDIHALVPEYPYYHWRQMHSEVQCSSKTGYENEDYYKAFIETVKRYINHVRKKSGGSSSDLSIMGSVFGYGKPLQVTHTYKKPDGSEFNQQTINSIEEGQKFLSMGIVNGARNPVSHEEISDLRDSGLFTEKDCLDALSLLSHLFRRLDDA